MSIKQLFTNTDNRTSNTGTVHFLGFIIMSAVLIYSVYLNRTYVPELFATFALFSGGLVVSKGAVSAYKSRRAQGSQSGEARHD